jgi:hypothetical protein
MTNDTLTIRLPREAARRLERVAEIAGRSVEEVAEEALLSALPALLDGVPGRLRSELRAMESGTEEALRAELETEMAPAAIARYDTLLAANAAGDLDGPAQQELRALRDEADRLMFRRAYAALILKWRGHRLPDPVTMQRRP